LAILLRGKNQILGVKLVSKAQVMPTREERLKILKMVEGGQISAEQGVKLMESLRGDYPESPEAPSLPVSNKKPQWLRIRVTDVLSSKVRVDVRLPVTLVSAGAKLGARFSPDVSGLDMTQIMESIRSGATGMIFMAEQQDHEKVEIFIE
jgi:hypothetical protein